MTILFVYRNLSTFVKRDFEILRENYIVIPLHTTKNLLKTILKLIYNMRRVNLVFIWFAGWHAFLAVLLAKIFRKKSVVIAGGYDATCIPKLSYGVFSSWWRGRLAKWTFENVDIVLAVSKHVKRGVLKFSDVKRIKVVYNGFDYKEILPKGGKEKLVMMVGSGKVKKPDLFLETANYLPRVKFVLFGQSNKKMKNQTSNVSFLGLVPFKKLLEYYRKTKVYVQLSAYEGFGCALAEAMLCGCIPVVTNRGAMPEVVGNTGYYVPYGNSKATAEAIKKALNDKSGRGNAARRRIKEKFDLSKRKGKLQKIIDCL